MSDPVRPSFVSVRFTPVGRAHSFLLPEFALDDALRPGERVVVETAAGSALGAVVPTLPAVADRREPPPDAPDRVIRRATPEDIVARLKQQAREREAFRFCQLRIRERGLEMKLTRVEQGFDGSRMTFYFTADHRVDFRELVRDLACEFHTRIELCQIGARDEAQMMGGYGSCGRPLCCTTWLRGFEPVSVKMAKVQGLSLNPSRLSGLCGRLKCCLRYELPNGNGEQFAGCAHEGGCSGEGCAGDGQCGSGGCGACARGT
jgi:cell fate regulator YaaT (PSP1 superfamily)